MLIIQPSDRESILDYGGRVQYQWKRGRERGSERERTTEGQSDMAGAGPDPLLGRGHKPESVDTSRGGKVFQEKRRPADTLRLAQ